MDNIETEVIAQTEETKTKTEVKENTDKVVRFCLIGHVDSGKSTTAGHILKLCNIFSEHEIKQNKKECEDEKLGYQLYSRLLDVNEEERVKGKTHEYSSINFTFKGIDGCRNLELIDTPGHKLFIRELIKGLSYIDPEGVICCLLISAKEGEFQSGWVKGQTKEDIILARSLGIINLVILINKMDTIEWDQEKYDSIKKTIEPFLKFCAFADYSFSPVSSYQGIGLTSTKDMPDWYIGKGKSLLETIIELKSPSGEQNQKIDQKINNKEWIKMKANIKVLWCPGIISSGYKCILHYSGDEYEVTLNKIIGKNYIKAGEKCKCILESDKIIVNNYGSRKIILRSNENTIGFGTIEEVK